MSHTPAIAPDKAREIYGYFGMDAALLVQNIERRELGVTQNDVVRAIRRGTLEYFKINDKLFVSPNQIIKYLERPDVGTIYVVGFGRYLKIGFSRNLRHRVSKLQSGVPVKLTVYRTMLGQMAEERELHRRFQAHRLTGEWFWNCCAIRQWMKRPITTRSPPEREFT